MFIFLPKQNIIKKKQVNQNLLVRSKRIFKIDYNKKYNKKAIKNSLVYKKKSKKLTIRLLWFDFLEKLYRKKTLKNFL